jgi:hypothetical protein
MDIVVPHAHHPGGMRTTLTIDNDVAARLLERCRRTGESFEAAVNEVLRSGLAARALGVRQGVDLDNVGELLEDVDGPAYK